MSDAERVRRLAELKAKSYNEADGTLHDGVDCPICRNKGNIALYDDKTGTVRFSECECMAQRRSLTRIRKSGLSELFDSYSFSTYQTPDDARKSVMDAATRFAAADKGWFIICGESGSGKTHICTAICGELLARNKSVFYFRWRRDAPALKASVNDRERYDELFAPLITSDVLYIDDFFKGDVTSADINLAFDIIDARYGMPRKRTVISTERSLSQICDIDGAIGSRIYERSKGFAVKAPSGNWRLKR